MFLVSKCHNFWQRITSLVVITLFSCFLTMPQLSSTITPVVVGNLSFGWREAFSVKVVGNYAYLILSSTGLQIIDISNPTAPTLVGSLSMPAHYVEIIGNYAYVADANGTDGIGLRIVNIANPAVPVLVGSLDTNGPVADLAVNGNYVYLACSTAGLKIMNISNPAVPVLVGSLVTTDAQDVAVSGDYAYVTDFTGGVSGGGLKVINIANPSEPVLVGSLAMNYVWHVKVNGNYAYVGDANRADGIELRIINIANPATPVLVGSSDSNSPVPSVTVDGNYVYLTCSNEGGLKIISVANPAAPVLAGSLVATRALDVAVSGNYAYLADGEGGFKVINISETPTLLSITVTPSSVSIVDGNTQQFVAMGAYSDNSTQNITSSVTWNSSNTSVATINGSGLATGVNTGTTNITATLSGTTSPARVLTITAVQYSSTGISSSSSSTGVSSSSSSTGILKSSSSSSSTGMNGMSSSSSTGGMKSSSSSSSSSTAILKSSSSTAMSSSSSSSSTGMNRMSSSSSTGGMKKSSSSSSSSSTGIKKSSSSSTGAMKSSSSSSSSSTGSVPLAPNPVAHEVSKSGTTNIPLVFSAEDFISNFTDTPGNGLMKIKITSLPDYGILKLSGRVIVINQEIAVENLGKLTYVPEASWNGSDSFKWNGSDGILYGNDDADVTITIDPIITPSFCTDHALICYVIPPILSATAIIIGVLKYTHKNNLWCFKKAAPAPSGVQLGRHIP